MLFDKPLHVGRPYVGDKDQFISYVNKIFDEAWLTNDGPFVQELEKKLAQYLGVNHCIVTCNGTAALGFAIRASGLSGEVIIPSFTFVATAHALSWQGITPVFCDIDTDSYCLSPEHVEELITPQTSAIIGVHLYGRPCDIEELKSVAGKHSLKLIFDAAHAMGCSYKGQAIGGFGHCEVFSFHATKVFNTFEGGAITTNDDKLAKELRLIRNFGFSGEDIVLTLGMNGKMSEVCGAMGLTNLKSLTTIFDINKRNWEAYRDGLDSIDGISLMSYDETERNNYQYVIIEVDKKCYGKTRDELQNLLRKDNILARRYFYPGVHRMEPYYDQSRSNSNRLKFTEAVAECILVLPTGSQITPSDVASICNLIRKLQDESRTNLAMKM